MATEKEIVVTISKDGSDIGIEPTKGFPDGTCLKETESLEAALGKVEHRDLKPEAYNKPVKSTVTVGS